MWYAVAVMDLVVFGWREEEEVGTFYSGWITFKCLCLLVGERFVGGGRKI